MQLVFQEIQELTTGLNAFTPAVQQAIDVIKAQRAELDSLKGEELAEDSKQARDEQSVLASLRSLGATLATMGEKIAEAVAEPTPEVEPDLPLTAEGTLSPVEQIPVPVVETTPAS